MKFLQYILLAFWFLLTNAAFAQDDVTSWRAHLKIVTKKGKQGVYNTKTKRFVIKPIYDEISYLYFESLDAWFDDNEIFNCYIGNKKLSLVVDLKDNTLYDFDESSNLFEFLILNNKQKKKGIYNAWKSKIIAKPIYDSIFFISWSLYHAINGINFKDNYGGCVVYNEIDFEAKRRQSEMYAIMIKGNKFVALNLKKEAIDSVSTLFYFKDIENIYGTGYQLIDLKGENYIFDSSFLLKNKFQVFCPKNDIIKKGNKYGLMNRQGNVYMPEEFDSIQRIKNYYLCFKNNNVSYAKTTLLNYGDSTWFKIDTIKIGNNGVQQVVGFDEDVFTIKINNKWRFRYFKDSFEYDSIYGLGLYEDNKIYVVKINNKWEFRNFSDTSRFDNVFKIGRNIYLKNNGKWSINQLPTYTRFGFNRSRIARNIPIQKKKKIRMSENRLYDLQTGFIWDSVVSIGSYGRNYKAIKNSFIHILDEWGISEFKINSKKVYEVGVGLLPYQYKYFSAEKIDNLYKVVRRKKEGQKVFVYIVINKQPLFKKTYKAKRYLQNGKLVKQPTFKKSIYAEIKSYLKERKWARQENRKLKRE